MTTAPEGRPQPLLWLYGLIAVSLASVGVAIGNLYFDGPLSRALPDRIARERCGALHRGSIDAFNACLADQVRLRGWAVAGGALLLLAGTLTLAVAVPWRDLRRLRRFGRLDSPAAQERFADLCRRHGLSGRHVPRLWVAGPAVRHAFTTALPGRRPTIVVPARLALGSGDRLDAVVTHEIAHVLARDVSWVSVVRGPAWLFVPVFALASVPMFGRSGAHPRLIAALIGTMLLAATVAVLAAVLLRLRELEADHYAAGAGAEDELMAFFSRATPPRRTRPWAWARRVLARHPDSAERALSLGQAARAWEGGFVQAVAVGFVASTAMSTVAVLADSLDLRLYAWGGSAIPAVTGAAVLTLLFPSLVRRAHARLPRPQWWRAAVGTGGGIMLGALVMSAVFRARQPPYPLVWPGSFARIALAIAVLALVAAGVVGLAVSVAELAARADRPVVARLAMGATGLAAVAGLWPVGATAALLHDSDDLRFFLTYGLGRFGWPALALGLLPAYALLSLRRAPRRRLPWLVALTAAAVASTAAILVRPATSQLTDQLQAQQQRWWICAAAGIVVLVVVTLTTPWPDGWARGVLAATATTAAATGAHYGYGWLTDRPPEPDLFAADIAVAPIWLGYATVLLAALLVPLTGQQREITPPAWSRWLAPAGTTVVTAAVALAVVGVGVPGGVAMNAQQLALASVDDRYATARHALTPQQADRVAQSTVLVLTPEWAVPESGPAGQGIVLSTVAVSDPACEPLVREGFLAAGKPHLKATGKRTWTTQTEDSGLTYTDLTVTVYSYDAPVGEAVPGAARDAWRACPSFTMDPSGASLDFHNRAAKPPPVGELSWRYDSTMSTTADGRTTDLGTNAYVVLVVGYTVITVLMSALQEPLDEQLLQRVLDTTENSTLYPN